MGINKEYPAYTINDGFEIVECFGIVESDNSWNYHNNYDDSEDILSCIFRDKISEGKINKWFTLNKDEVIKIQKENLEIWMKILQEEILRISNM